VQSKNKYWAEVVSRSKKVIALVDLCGHEKYLKTTMLGMVGLIPDYVLIVVGANLGLSRMTKEHLGIALALNLPFMVVVTKVDMVPEETLKQTLSDLTKLLSANVVGKKPLIIDYDDKKEEIEDDKLIAETKDLTVKTEFKLSDKEEELLDKAVEMINSERICPIFKFSSVTGNGVPQLSRFLYKLKSRNNFNKDINNKNAPVEFDIHEKFVVQGIGLVVSGLLKSGTIKTNSQLLMGPNKMNEYKQIVVRSIHFNRVPVGEVYTGQFCCLALKPLKKKEDLDKSDLRKGIVLLDAALMPKPCWAFEAEVSVLHHSSTIKAGYEAVLHCGVIRQSARIIKMDRDLLRTGDKGNITFRFMFNSEYLKPNSTFLLREGRTKILGFITKVFNKLEDVPE
jgi:GTPase